MIVSATAQPPCKGCSERALNCHSRCAKYKTYKQKLEENRAKVNAETEIMQFNRDVKQRIASLAIRKSRRGGE